MNKVIITAVLCILICVFNAVIGQNNYGNSNDEARIAMGSFVDESRIEDMPSAAAKLLTNKLTQAVSKSGMGGSNNSRFFVTANSSIISKEVVQSAGAMVMLKIELTVYVADVVDEKVFGSTSIELTGVDVNLTKAYREALRGLKPTHKDLQSLITEAKVQIIEYYNTNCSIIIKEAQTLADQQKFNEAIYVLSNVPTVCKDCYDQSMEAVKPIFQSQIDLDCKRLLTQAKAQWSSGQNAEVATKVAEILVNINPQSSCVGDVNALVGDIQKKVQADEKRDWDFEMKKYNDEQALYQAAINSIRDIGVAYGNNQPETVYKTSWIW